MIEWLTDDTTRELIDRSTLMLALVMARVAPIVELIPFLGGRATPRTVKTALSLALVVLLFPVLWTPGLLATEISAPQFALLAAKEVLVGMTIGFVAALVFEAVRMAGQIIDAARGQTMANVMVPQLPERVSVTSEFLYLFAVALFFTFDGHHVFVGALAESYVAVPLATMPTWTATTGAELAFTTARLTADAIALAITFAFPVVGSILLADLVLAMINRSAPQVNVFFLGMPLKAALGTAVVLLGLGVFADEFVTHALSGLTALKDLIHLSRGS